MAATKTKNGRRRITSVEEDKEIVRLYTKSMWPIRRIASYMQLSYTTTHDRLEEAGVKFRSRGNPASLQPANRKQHAKL
jgi:hypothetical protein